jgi:hypothetical protein
MNADILEFGMICIYDAVPFVEVAFKDSWLFMNDGWEEM